MAKNKKEHSSEQDFNFIQEKVVCRKRQKIKKAIITVIITIILGGIFGLAACATFNLAEEPLYRLFGKNKKVVKFSSEEQKQNDSESPSDEISTEEDDTLPTETEEETESKEDVSKPVILERTIAADINDLSNIYSQIKKIADESCNAMVEVTSTKKNKDWFENEIDIPNETIGLIVANNNVDLLVLVNYDRVKGSNTIMVSFCDNSKAEARLQSFDSELNIAIIAIPLEHLSEEIKGLEAAYLGESSYLPVGTPVIAIGSPNGHIGSIELGMVNSGGTNVQVTDYQIDLFHTDTNFVEESEGYIINTRGNIIGIITTHLTDNRSEKVSTSIGISSVKPIIESLVNNKDRTYFGIKSMDITGEALEELDIENGIAVTEVFANSPAYQSGIQVGDIIVSVNGEEIATVKDFQKMLLETEPNDVLSIKLQRGYSNSEETDNNVIEVEVTLETRKL